MRVLVTGNEDLSLNKSEKILTSLKKLKIDAQFLPTIRTIRKNLSAQSVSALKRLPHYDYLLFTSANAVNFFVKELRERKVQLPARKNFPKVIAVGPETARACREQGFRVSVMPKEFSGTGVAKILKAEGIAGKKILFPQSVVGSTEITKDMRAAGAHVSVIPLYTTLPVSPQTSAEKASFTALFKHEFSYIIFMSPSTVKSFRASVSDFSKSTSSSILREKIFAIPALCIGPVTAEAAKRAGFKKVFTSETFTASGLVSTIQHYLK